MSCSHEHTSSIMNQACCFHDLLLVTITDLGYALKPNGKIPRYITRILHTYYINTGKRMRDGKRLRSLLFVPSNDRKMIDKIDTLRPDAFILDLEDSVPKDQKEEARRVIAEKMSNRKTKGDDIDIFIRINDLGAEYSQADIAETICPGICGYLIPKFESVNELTRIAELISQIEKKQKIIHGKTKLMLLVESLKGINELKSLQMKELFGRLNALVLGGEDYLSSLSCFFVGSEDMLDFARKMILLYAKSNDLLAIDTVYKSFRDPEGLKSETNKIARMGFDGKLAIHPNQIEIINNSFKPSDEEMERIKLILKYREIIERNGAIDVNGNMLDTAHLKWAQKAANSLDEMNDQRSW